MALSFGFFNSVNGDRKYNSRQISHLFDGMIADGVMSHVGSHFAITAGPGMAVTVGTGRAWFNHTWCENDSNYVVDVNPGSPAAIRKDSLVLEVDERETIRDGAIKIVRGSESGGDPVLTNTDKIHQHVLAYISVPIGATSISQENITVMVGTSECPFATSILESVSIDNLFAQWDAEFNDWFENLKTILDGDVAASLQHQVDDLKENKADKEDLVEVGNEVYNKSVAIGDIVISGTDLSEDPNGRGKFIYCNGTPNDNLVVREKFSSRRYFGDDYLSATGLYTASISVTSMYMPNGNVIIKTGSNVGRNKWIILYRLPDGRVSIRYGTFPDTYFSGMYIQWILGFINNRILIATQSNSGTNYGMASIPIADTGYDLDFSSGIYNLVGEDPTSNFYPIGCDNGKLYLYKNRRLSSSIMSMDIYEVTDGTYVTKKFSLTGGGNTHCAEVTDSESVGRPIAIKNGNIILISDVQTNYLQVFNDKGTLHANFNDAKWLIVTVLGDYFYAIGIKNSAVYMRKISAVNLTTVINFSIPFHSGGSLLGFTGKTAYIGFKTNMKTYYMFDIIKVDIEHNILTRIVFPYSNYLKIPGGYIQSSIRNVYENEDSIWALDRRGADMYAILFEKDFKDISDIKSFNLGGSGIDYVAIPITNGFYASIDPTNIPNETWILILSNLSENRFNDANIYTMKHDSVLLPDIPNGYVRVE